MHAVTFWRMFGEFGSRRYDALLPTASLRWSSSIGKAWLVRTRGHYGSSRMKGTLCTRSREVALNAASYFQTMRTHGHILRWYNLPNRH